MRSNSVCVIVPCFNAGAFIEEALQSVFAQDYETQSVIVVDDGSTDDTLERLQMFRERIRVIRIARSGPAMARNVGLENSQSDLVAFLDADDLWFPQKTRSQVAYLQRHPDVDIVLGRVRRFRDASSSSIPSLYGPYLGSALIRRSVFEQVGRLDPLLKFGEDIDWFLRALEAGAQLSLMNVDCLRYRQHAASLTSDVSKAQQSLLGALHRSIKRRTKASFSIAKEGV